MSRCSAVATGKAAVKTDHAAVATGVTATDNAAVATGDTHMLTSNDARYQEENGQLFCELSREGSVGDRFEVHG